VNILLAEEVSLIFGEVSYHLRILHLSILMNVQRLGIYHEQVVALKVLRVFAVDGVLAELRKVSDRFLAHAFSKLCSRSSVKRPWFGVN
jgi:hypothetical protein